MPDGLPAILLLAGAPAGAALVGGWAALHHRPNTLLASIVYGFAGGAMIGTVALEMVPTATDNAGLWPSVGALVAGFAVIYAFDLWMHGGAVAGEHAQQRRRLGVYRRHQRAERGNAAVLAGATSLEEPIEGMTIGIALALDPALAVVVGTAVLINNFAESMAIGEMLREEAGDDARAARRSTLRWTATIAIALVSSALVAWLLLRDMPMEWLGVIVAAGAGGLLYLALSDLVPEAHERHFQHSGALAGGLGFVLILILAAVAGG